MVASPGSESTLTWMPVLSVNRWMDLLIQKSAGFFALSLGSVVE
jgi:hypothetical protein